MAVGLWAVRLDEAVPEEMERRMWENLPPRRRARLERQKNGEKALEALAAYWILRRAVEEQYHWSGALPPMAWTEGGKPFFPGEPDVHFSLSHTPGGVLVGLSALPLGVDLERVRPVHPAACPHGLRRRRGLYGQLGPAGGPGQAAGHAGGAGSGDTAEAGGAAVAGGGLSGLSRLCLLYGGWPAPDLWAAAGGHILISKKKKPAGISCRLRYVYTILRRRSGVSCRDSPAK